MAVVVFLVPPERLGLIQIKANERHIA